MPIGGLRPELRMAAASDPVLRSINAFEKITQTERGRPSSNRAKSMQDPLLRTWRHKVTGRHVTERLAGIPLYHWVTGST